MWIKITDISIKQLDTSHLKKPKDLNNQMILNLFQRESRTAFWISTTKKIYPQYLEAPMGKVIQKRKWTEDMKSFAKKELNNLPPQKGGIKVTLIGWLFLLFALGQLGYLTYLGIQEPAKKKQYQQELIQKATVSEGDIYLGRIEVYKEKGTPIGMKREFGWFKIESVENNIYYIAKSTEMAKISQEVIPGSNINFIETTIAVKAKELGAYHKSFISEDGLTEIAFTEKKK